MMYQLQKTRETSVFGNKASFQCMKTQLLEQASLYNMMHRKACAGAL